MAICKYQSSCNFYNDRLDDIPALADLLKENYCGGNYRDCARYDFAKVNGITNVPDYILPNDKDFISLFNRPQVGPGNRRQGPCLRGRQG